MYASDEKENADLSMLRSAIDSALPAPWVTTIEKDFRHDPYILISDDPSGQLNGPCGSMGFFSIEINYKGKLQFGTRSRHRVRKVTQANCEYFANICRDKALARMSWRSA